MKTYGGGKKNVNRVCQIINGAIARAQEILNSMPLFEF